MRFNIKALGPNARFRATSTRRASASSPFLSVRIDPKLFGPKITVHKASPVINGWNHTRFILVPRNHKRESVQSEATEPAHSIMSLAANWVQVLSTPTADSPGACLLVHHDHRRYLFGQLSEGTQRLIIQRKLSLGKAEEMFITGPINWQTTGGLLGMVLTIADIVKSAQNSQAEAAALRAQRGGSSKAAPKSDVMSSLSLHGAGNLSHLLATARRFIFRKGLPIKPHEITTDCLPAESGAIEPSWQDSNIMVWYVPLFADDERVSPPRKRDHEAMASGKGTPEAEKSGADKQLVDFVVKHMFDSDWALDSLVESTLHTVQLPAKLFVRDKDGALQHYKGPLPGEADDVPDIPVLTRRPWPGATVKELPRTRPLKQSMCYIVRNHPRRGKFNARRAAEYGVEGSSRARLARGEMVTGKDGMTITPDMVLDPTIEGRAFAVVDLPDASYIDPFLARPEWNNSQMLNSLSVIYWNLGPGVVLDARILQFMEEKQKTSVRNIVSSVDTGANVLTLESAASVQIRLNRIDPDRFPIQQFDNRLPMGRDAANQPFEVARPGHTIQLGPQFKELDDRVVPLVEASEALRKLDRETLQMADEARARVAEAEFVRAVEQSEQDMPNRDAEVIPLGTGSALPSKYRNVSATLVRVPGVGSYLFDSGENTLGSMRRLFGYQKTDEVLRDLRAIWISHLHADHHLGTASVVRAWRDATAADPATCDARLAVASHVNMLDWLREYADVEDYGYSRVRPVELTAPEGRVDVACAPVVFDAAEAREFGLASIAAARVDHCHGALACVFDWPSGLRIAYSGDCRPSEAFVRLGRGATLLIHEATFEDGPRMEVEAVAKKHCTIGEALDVARRMGARRVLLTHFSQRYPKIPVFDLGRHGGGGSGGREGGEASDETLPAGQATEDPMVVLMAFDQMVVKLGEFKMAAQFLPALQNLFKYEEE